MLRPETSRHEDWAPETLLFIPLVTRETIGVSRCSTRVQIILSSETKARVKALCDFIFTSANPDAIRRQKSRSSESGGRFTGKTQSGIPSVTWPVVKVIFAARVGEASLSLLRPTYHCAFRGQE